MILMKDTPQILTKIVSTKEGEIKALYQTYDIENLKKEVAPSPLSFYDKLASAQGKIFITEFKRKSPSAGWINKDVAIEKQLQQYRDLGTNAVSVLTDHFYFGGTYDDLEKASAFLQDTDICILNKEFVIDEIQIYLARKFGAHIILLIAAILETEQFIHLKNVAELLGMGVIAEVHNLEEYQKIETATCKVLGINNRNLNNFKTAINNCNYIANNINHTGYIIAESGMASALDLAITGKHAKGFLIGTSLMQQDLNLQKKETKSYFFKACGIREAAHLKENLADLMGVNFSPISKRKVDFEILNTVRIRRNMVSVFYQNAEAEILEILEKYNFEYAQLYANDVSFEFVQQLKKRVLLAIRWQGLEDLKLVERYAPFVDLFILDAPKPGSGKQIESPIPKDFPYPFLLAGGINIDNAKAVLKYDNCIGIDVASGIEKDGVVDLRKSLALSRFFSELVY